ncbi:ATP-binding cassette sub-family D member 3-like [Saccoglossus kowalevskii]|uniref:ATP-binding cassette sub-family D member 3-like n=1 Tax=Saccoglossus kowalevskii TaxID=10224 RepID=A0ABM0N0F3_SACKO|nr:PREDICTED: ATP-binding cassette sub-family D member 3-like [Saccoglossus kowalevskii]
MHHHFILCSVSSPHLGVKIGEKQTGGSRDKAALDRLFLSRMWRILKVLIPGWFTLETGYVILIAIMLIARTYCDVWMISNGTAIESAIIGRDVKLFRYYLFKFIYAMPAVSISSLFIQFGLNMLKLRFRQRLTDHFYDKYLRGNTYYKMTNLDNRISNADQLLTQDTEKYCNSVVDLYSNLSKPLLDIVIYIRELTGAIGIQGPASMMGYLAFSGLILTRLRRPIGKMTVTEQRYEGEFRYVNSRLITNSEEIAFYQGGEREKKTIRGTFAKLIGHLNDFVMFRFNMGFVDNIVAKYIATVVGYLVVSRPFLNLSDPRHLHSSHTELLEDYYKSGRMLVKMAQAIGRIVLAGREMTRLAGFTARVTDLMSVLEDLNRGHYERTMVNTSSIAGNRVDSDSEEDRQPLVPGSGQVILQDHLIRFEHVPLVTPNGDLLIKDMTFEVPSGMNVLVCGPNGCGKSSLFRVLGELWPLFGGKMTKPEKGKLFYIPQRPYMTIGTFRDQVIYPDSKYDMNSKGFSDESLEDYLDKVQLSYLLEREGGWDSIQDWMDVLSGGEKQRIAMARVFYHKPQFAILDECTSAVSVDVEGFMYNYCKEQGITLFTVSHRKSLWKHHEYFLHMDGRGKYDFKKITDETIEFGS